MLLTAFASQSDPRRRLRLGLSFLFYVCCAAVPFLHPSPAAGAPAQKESLPPAAETLDAPDLALEAIPPDPLAAEEIEQVIVLVFARPGWWDQIAVTYDRKVSEAQARKDLTELARRAGWKPDSVKITHDAGVPGSPVMTSVEFVAQAIDPGTHSFPLEPIVTTFRRFRRVGAVFILPPGFPYWGPLDYQAPGVVMRGERAQGTYTFHFTLTDPNLQQFKIPLENPNAPPERREAAPDPKQILIRLALVVGLALLAAGVVYGIASFTRTRG